MLREGLLLLPPALLLFLGLLLAVLELGLLVEVDLAEKGTHSAILSVLQPVDPRDVLELLLGHSEGVKLGEFTRDGSSGASRRCRLESWRCRPCSSLHLWRVMTVRMITSLHLIKSLLEKVQSHLLAHLFHHCFQDVALVCIIRVLYLRLPKHLGHFSPQLLSLDISQFFDSWCTLSLLAQHVS